MRLPLSLLFIAAAATQAFGQVLSFTDVLSGRGLPTRISAQDLPEGYGAVKISLSNESEYGAMMMPMMLFSGGQEGRSPYMLDAIMSYWTKGETMTVEGQRFLAAYKVETDFSQLAMRGGSSIGPFASPHMSLHLLKVDAITSISANPLLSRDRLLEAVGLKEPVTPLPASPQEVASKKTATLSNVKQLALGAIMYASDYDDHFPYVQNTATIRDVTMPYIKNTEVWTTHNPNGGRILFNMALAGVEMMEIDTPATIPLYYDEKAWPDGSRVVAYVDGHAKIVNADGWAALAGEFKKRFKRKGRPLPVSRSSPNVK